MATAQGLRRRLRLIGVLPGLCALLTLLAAVPAVEPGYGRVVVGGATVLCGLVCVVAWRLSGTTAAAVDAVETARQQAEAARLQAEAARLQKNADQVAQLRARLPEALEEIQVFVDQVRRGEQPQVRAVQQADPAGDPLARLACDLNEFVQGVKSYVARSSADRDRAALLVLGRRMVTLTTATISGFDRLEQKIEDPDILGPVFRLDHKVTRVHRFAASLIILGGGAPRESRTPDELSLVIWHALQEVEHYERVTVITPVDTLVRGRVTAGLVHLLAELIDNAANFSPPDQPVTVRVSRVPAGFAIEVEDRGSPIPADTMENLNQLLADPASRYTGEYVRTGRLGLWVVSLLAKRFGVRVQLQTNAYGANSAIVVLPAEQLHADNEPRDAQPVVGRVPVRQPHQPGAGAGSGEVPAETTLALPAVRLPARQPVAPRPAGGRAAEPVAALPRRVPARAGQPAVSRTHPAGEQPSGTTDDRPPLARRETSQKYSHPGLRTEPEAGDSSRAAPSPALARAFFAGGRAPAAHDVDRDAPRPDLTSHTPHEENDHAE
ncbi:MULTISPECIES: ATP-binding protein [Streptomyces]|uniref:histidine kinase n=1 Tax=Streptomyces eurythermus TaxID=42237 RepID=A0ABW6Z3L7_9ACTN|nr:MULTISPECIES: ATP-binding protein [Streptomyces]QIS75156.1 ATP-binding protein [Streptomyces sp. DSM 40868]